MSDWFEKYKKALKKADAVSWYIGRISQLLEEVGNTKLSKRLLLKHLDLEQAIEEIDNAVSQNINEQYLLAQQSSANVLKAALAGGELSRREKEKDETS